MKQVHLRIDDNLYEELTMFSTDESKSLQDSVREAILCYFSNKIKQERPNQNARFCFIDLFAGIGGMRLAFQAQGGKCLFSSEWDKYCQNTYFANFNEIPKGNIREIDEKDIPEHDILLAGFPCQPFSIAGVSKKNSLGRETGFLDQTQGTLFFDVVRILKEKRPKAFLLENVKNLKSHDKGNTWAIILAALKELHYEVFAEVIDGQAYVPQHRERIFIVGFDKQRYGENIKFAFDMNRPKRKPVLRDILMDRVDTKYTLSDDLWNYLQEYARKHHERGNGFGYGMPDPDGITRTLSARYYKDGSEILIAQNGRNPRKLTPRECARLQGYKDDFKIVVSDTQAYKQFGNSVVVPLVTCIAEKIVNKMEELESKRENKVDAFAENAIKMVNKGKIAYCKFLSANDTGATYGHQSGIYIAKTSYEILFDQPGTKGSNKDKWVKITWQEDFQTDSRFIYYGKGTRNEYRITNFKRDFPFLKPEHTGDLFILVKLADEDYYAYVLEDDESINIFLDAFAMSPSDTNVLIRKGDIPLELSEQLAFDEFEKQLDIDFPLSSVMSEQAREICDKLYNNDVVANPDNCILAWTEMEYRLFRYLEKMRYLKIINEGFQTVDSFVEMANKVLNRRKSRAGKSLEHHLCAVFDAHHIAYTAQPKTEGNKKPDFIFPSIVDYHNFAFNFEGLTYLGAKTTCKDRWRQILNEADRIPKKYLFTLQQGISPQQMDEMKKENVVLVVPQKYIEKYPKSKRDMIINLDQFLSFVKIKESKKWI